MNLIYIKPVNDLRVVIDRLPKAVVERRPLLDRTNLKMFKANFKKVGNGAPKEVPRKRSECRIILDRNPELDCRVQKSQNPNKVRNSNLDEKESIGSMKKQSIPLVNRLRKCTNKDYRESSLEDSTVQNVSNVSDKPKVPIYKQTIPVKNITNSKDPYALDFEFDEEKPKKTKLNSSAKFDKTMHEILSKIEKKEKKTAARKIIVQKKPKKYEANINKALERVMLKVKKKKGTDKCEEKNAVSIHPVLTNVNRKTYPKMSANKERVDNLGVMTEEGFLGFDNSHRYSDKNETKNSSKDIINTSNAHIKYHSTPHRTQSKINIISNISLNNPSAIVEFTQESHNSHRQFHNNTPLSHNHSITICKTLQNEENDDHFEDDNYPEEYIASDDEYFGFGKETDDVLDIPTTFFKKKQIPWRFQGYFKRNPHMLRIKRNGLPCLQQEMVIDHEFVKRIEALSERNTAKHPEPPPAKATVQTTMLDYIRTNQEHAEPQKHSSLFDYEEFVVAKTQRKILGEIHDNQQIISTPKKTIETLVASPNISVIARDENIENRIPICYKKKGVLREEPEMLPSILEKECEEMHDSDIKLFEDVDGDKKIDFSIKLPHFKYGNKRQRKRHSSEGSDDEEDKKPKRKKKDMRTKAEEAEFEAWAEKINAQFAEDAKHELTIE